MDLLEAVVNAFTSITENSGEWNRETVNLASSLLKCILSPIFFLVQWLLSFTSSLTIGLQKQNSFTVHITRIPVMFGSIN